MRIFSIIMVCLILSIPYKVGQGFNNKNLIFKQPKNEKITEKVIEKTISKKVEEKKHKDLKVFIKRIIYIESRGKINAFNGHYLGKYQMGKSAMNDMNFEYNQYKFLNDFNNYFPEERQDSLYIEYIKKIKWRYMYKYIKLYNGSVIKGVKINEASIVAGSHFLGVGSMRKFLETNGDYNPQDGNQKSLLYFMSKFDDLKIKIDPKLYYKKVFNYG